jgi:hypothetical protein
MILNDAWVVNLRDNKLYNKEKGEQNEKSEVGIGSEIQSNRDESSSKRRRKSGSRRSSSRDEKVRKSQDGEDGAGRQEA